MFKIGKLEIKSPLFLAPMAGVTDHPFRLICRQYVPELFIQSLLVQMVL